MPLPLVPFVRGHSVCAAHGAKCMQSVVRPVNEASLYTISTSQGDRFPLVRSDWRYGVTASTRNGLLTGVPNDNNWAYLMGMTSPRYSPGGYYTAPSYPDTPIYDMLVNERGTPQIAPIRVPSAYEPMGTSLPALPPARPALPAAPGPQQHHTPAHGYPAAMGMGSQPTQPGMAQPAPLQSAPLQQAPAPYIPQQAPAQRGYPEPRQYPQQQQQAPPPQMRPVAPRPAAPRPAAPRPAAPRPMNNGYDDPYGGHQYPGRGY
jgi:hypothetical protein